MINKSSEANPNPDRQDDRSDLSEQDFTAEQIAEEYREILENFEPDKGVLEEEDIAYLRKLLEERRAVGRAILAKGVPNLRVVQDPDRKAEDAQKSASQSKPDVDDRERDPHPDVREEMYRGALLRRIADESYRDIAQYYNRSPRTIQRWVKKAKERNLLRVDKIKPAQELATTLFMLHQHRARLMHLRDQFLENDQFDRGLKVIDMLVKLEDKINRIQHRVGVFDDYTWCGIENSLPGWPGRREVDDGEDDDIENAA